MLFKRPINFDSYENDGNRRYYWLFTDDYGWIHRDQIMLGLMGQDADEKIETPDDGYGRQTTPDAVSRNGGQVVHQLNRR